MHERVLFWRVLSVPHFRPPAACKSSLRTKDLVARAVPLTSGALSEATSYARRCCGSQGRMPHGAPIFAPPGVREQGGTPADDVEAAHEQRTVSPTERRGIAQNSVR